LVCSVPTKHRLRTAASPNQSSRDAVLADRLRHVPRTRRRGPPVAVCRRVDPALLGARLRKWRCKARSCGPSPRMAREYAPWLGAAPRTWQGAIPIDRISYAAPFSPTAGPAMGNNRPCPHGPTKGRRGSGPLTLVEGKTGTFVRTAHPFGDIPSTVARRLCLSEASNRTAFEQSQPGGCPRHNPPGDIEETNNGRFQPHGS
jgi:hypothetical protein